MMSQQQGEAQQVPLVEVNSETSQAESLGNATSRLADDELRTIEVFQREHDIMLSKVQLEAVAYLLHGLDVVSMWATSGSTSTP